jgi:hypothetical protein
MLIRWIGYCALSQSPFTRARLRGQDVAGKGMAANYFAGSRLLEPLGRTFMSLQLRHLIFLDSVATYGDVLTESV